MWNNVGVMMSELCMNDDCMLVMSVCLRYDAWRRIMMVDDDAWWYERINIIAYDVWMYARTLCLGSQATRTHHVQSSTRRPPKQTSENRREVKGACINTCMMHECV